MEEFGIANLLTPLNRFQLGKRGIYNGKNNQHLWSWVQNNSEELLIQGAKQFMDNKIYRWHKAQIDNGPGIYYVENIDYGLIYIGESSNIYDRYKKHGSDTRFSALRRHIATELLGYELKTKNELGLETSAKKEKRMFLSQDEDLEVNRFLKRCYIRTEMISFGRYELENYLIKKLRPTLNIKGNH